MDPEQNLVFTEMMSHRSKLFLRYIFHEYPSNSRANHCRTTSPWFCVEAWRGALVRLRICRYPPLPLRHRVLTVWSEGTSNRAGLITVKGSERAETFLAFPLQLRHSQNSTFNRHLRMPTGERCWIFPPPVTRYRVLGLFAAQKLGAVKKDPTVSAVAVLCS